MPDNGRRFIPLFIEAGERVGVPPAYLYALAGRESRWEPRKVAGLKGPRPDADATKGAAGLLQITGPVLKDYNREHGTTWRKRDMFNPELNVAVGAWYLGDVVLPLFGKRDAVHWDSPGWVATFTYLWNAGPYAGIRLYDELVKRGQRPTVDAVRALARAVVKGGGTFAGLPADKYHWFAARPTRWALSVARDYMRARARPDFQGAPVA